MRKKKAYINIIFSLLLQFITVLSGFIVPRLLIKSYGSEVNGLVNSITSFVGYISLLQLGVGSVVKASLYKPLADKNSKELSVIVKTTKLFFNKITLFSVIYLIILSFVFPIFLASDFDLVFTSSLVIIIGLSTAAQYFYGITYQMILEADQKFYIYSIIQIISIIINTIIVILLINCDFNVHIVKLASTIIYVIRPIIIGLITKKMYKLDYNVKADNNLLKQRWDGFIQAIALFIHQKTDVFVLTLFSSLVNVSIYTTYAMIVTGITSIIDSIDKSIRAAFGNMIAKNEKDNLKNKFESYNLLIHLITTVLFSTTVVTISSFIELYTAKITTINYVNYFFGIIIVSAEYMYCLRLPYNSIIFAAGRFKETKKAAGIEAIINVILSVFLVNKFGIVGIAIGTLCAMIYRTFSFIYYLHNNILMLNILKHFKQYFISFLSYFVIIFLFNYIKIDVKSYYIWILFAIGALLSSCFVVLTFNFIFQKNDMKKLFNIFKKEK